MPTPRFTAPVLGVSDGTPFIDQPGKVTAPDALLNIITHNPATGRGQLSTRAKVASEFSGARGTGIVGGISSIARASGTSGVSLTRTTSGTDGESIPSGPFIGQACVLDNDRSVRLVLNDTRGTGLSSPPTGAGGHGGFVCCYHASNADIGYFGTVAVDTVATNGVSLLIVGVNRFSLVTNAITHQKYVLDEDAPYVTPATGTTHLVANKVRQFGPYVFVAAQRYVYVFKDSDLTYICRLLIDWTEEAQDIDVVTVDGVDYLMVLSTGTRVVNAGGGDTNPVVTDGGASPEYYGEHYRTAILKHEILYLNAAKDAVAVGSAALIRRAMPMGLESGDAGYEDHRSFRISEYSASRPRGRLAFAMTCEVTDDGEVYAYIATCNQGFGYNGALAGQSPDGASPFITVSRAVLTRAFEAGAPTFIDPDSPVRYGFSEDVGGWERDSDGSLRRPFPWHGATYQNDIPVLSSGSRNEQALANGPSVWAVALDTTRRRVFFAGRRSSLSLAAPNVFAFDADTGDLEWEADTTGDTSHAVVDRGTVQQSSIAVDPVTGNVLVGMIRCQNWTRADGTIAGEWAELLELAGENGQTVTAFDLTDGINYNGFLNENYSIGTYGVAVNSRGQVLLALAPFRNDV